MTQSTTQSTITEEFKKPDALILVKKQNGDLSDYPESPGPQKKTFDRTVTTQIASPYAKKNHLVESVKETLHAATDIASTLIKDVIEHKPLANIVEDVSEKVYVHITHYEATISTDPPK